MPLMVGDEVIGTFNVESPRPSAFSSRDLEFIVRDYGRYALKVESNLPDMAWPPDTRYGLKVEIEQ